MKSRERTALGSLLLSDRRRPQFAFIIIFLIVVVDHVAADRDHVEALSGLSHTHFKVWEGRTREGLPDHDQSVSMQPISTPRELQLDGGANIDATTDAAQDPSVINTHLRQLRMLASHERVGQQAGQQVDGSTRSKQEVEALSRFKSTISSGGLATLRSWRANDTTACAWAGVVCSPSNLTQHPHVTGLILRGQNLVGHITSALLALGQLAFLQRLDLSDNFFSGFISGTTLSNLSRLTYLNASYNRVSGAIPSQIDVLVNVGTLDLGGNNLTGQIPLSIGNCTSLRRISLYSNLLQGRIPHVLGRLLQLQSLDLGSYFPEIVTASDSPPTRNSFSGSIPSALGNCSLLTRLDLQYTPTLGGEIFPVLSQLQHLKYLSLRWCSFTGTLPAWIGNVTSLEVLKLSGNKFHGHIPDELGQLRSLTALHLSAMYLTGPIPTAIFNCTLLTSLSLTQNLISGIIPPQVGSLRSLKLIFLANNDFTGITPSALANCTLLEVIVLGWAPLMTPEVIPSWITSFSNLRELDLWGTEISANWYGHIPNDIGRLSELEYLELPLNNLTGPIPVSLKNCTSLRYLLLYSNYLTGHIPSEIGLLKHIRVFWLFNNSLTGPFPPSFTNLTKLEDLQVQNNFLHGEIGSQWRLLSQLSLFNFSGNQFAGPIPRTLSNCSNLFLVDLSNNNLTGKIPPSFGNLSRLEQLGLSNNQIGGMVPVDLARCPLLGGLYLRGNKLEGNFPSSIYSLVYLDLSHNKLSRIILQVHSFQNFIHLLKLDLSYNRFTGSAHGQLFSTMPALTSLNLSHNRFSGSWPLQWSHLERIQKVDISTNLFSGPILNDTFMNLKSLVSLDLSRNNFSGPLPGSLTSISSLVLFNASYNNFEGPIPTSGAFKSNITGASFLGNPELCGAILGPSRECLTQTETFNEACKFFSCKKIWIPVCVGVPPAMILILIATGLVWRRIRVVDGTMGHQRNDGFDLFLSFGSNVKFDPIDILRIIRGGDENVIGVGGRSIVYKGAIPGYDSASVAIKAFPGSNADDAIDAEASELWEKQLVQEASNQAKLRHRNILKILSFCSTPDFRALVLEYMPRGSLNDQLHSRFADRRERTCELPWDVRLRIISDIAEGMKYLHHDCPGPIIHGDLNPSNILLGDDLIAKVADFGISKIVTTNRDGEATVSKIYGTTGYMAPEYASQTNVSTKGDVYSYGTLLLEMVTGKRPTSTDFGPEADYRGCILKLFQERPIDLLDCTLQQEAKAHSIKYKQMMLLVRVALFSTRDAPSSRPSMEDLLCMLVQIREFGLEPVTRRTIEELANADDNSANNDGIQIWVNQDPNDINLPSL